MSDFNGQSRNISRFMPNQGQTSDNAIDYINQRAATDPNYREAAIQNTVEAMRNNPNAQEVYRRFGLAPVDDLFASTQPVY